MPTSADCTAATRAIVHRSLHDDFVAAVADLMAGVRLGAPRDERTDLGPRVVPAAGRAAALADVLDLELASERAAGRVTSAGEPVPLPDLVRRRWPALPATWTEHEDLTVDGVAVGWWVEGGTGGDALVLHASTSDGLARAVASAAGRWSDRHLAAVLLDEDADALDALVDDVLG